MQHLSDTASEWLETTRHGDAHATNDRTKFFLGELGDLDLNEAVAQADGQLLSVGVFMRCSVLGCEKAEVWMNCYGFHGTGWEERGTAVEERLQHGHHRRFGLVHTRSTSSSAQQG